MPKTSSALQNGQAPPFSSVLPEVFEIDIEEPASRPGASAVVSWDPSNERERYAMMNYDNRVETFTKFKWNSRLSKSKTTKPTNMASIGWFCTGSDCAKCYACFKDLEGWEPKDDPEIEHDKHCPECPLTRLKTPPLGLRTWKEQTRLDIAIEFYRKKLIKQKEWEKVDESFNTNREILAKLMKNASKGVFPEQENGEDDL